MRARYIMTAYTPYRRACITSMRRATKWHDFFLRVMRMFMRGIHMLRRRMRLICSSFLLRLKNVISAKNLVMTSAA